MGWFHTYHQLAHSLAVLCNENKNNHFGWIKYLSAHSAVTDSTSQSGGVSVFLQRYRFVTSVNEPKTRIWLPLLCVIKTVNDKMKDKERHSRKWRIKWPTTGEQSIPNCHSQTVDGVPQNGHRWNNFREPVIAWTEGLILCRGTAR